MALLEKDLYVKDSNLPGAGKGLFTKVDIEPGTRIVEYKGRITTWKEVEDDSENGYLFVVNDQHVIDASRTKKAMARYANDASGLIRIKGIRNNSRYTNDNGKVYIEAVKHIAAGSEIFVGYGKEYWDVVRHNRRVDNKKASGKRQK